MRFVPLAFLPLALVGCSSVGQRVDHPGPEAGREGYRILDPTPALPRGQLTGDCGPEALAAVLDYHRRPASLPELEQLLYSATPGGTPSVLMSAVAQQKGLTVQLLEGGHLDLLRRAVHDSVPAIIMIRFRDMFHFFVIVGYNDRTRQLVCADYDGKIFLLSYDRLDELWRPAGHFAMTLHSPEVESLLQSAYEFEVGGQYDQAAKRFEQAVELQPTHAAALAGLGDCRRMLNRFEDAEPLFRRALAADPDHPRALVGLGHCALNRRDLGIARGHFERAVRAAPDDAGALNDLAHVLLEEGVETPRPSVLAEEAVRRMRERLRLLEEERDRDIPGKKILIRRELGDARWKLSFYLGTLGKARAANGRDDEAIGAWQESFDLLPETEPDLRAGRLLQIGDAWIRLGMRDRALEVFRRGFELAKNQTLRDEFRRRLDTAGN